LASVVEGWRKKELIRDTAYNRLKEEKENMESTNQRQEEV